MSDTIGLMGEEVVPKRKRKPFAPSFEMNLRSREAIAAYIFLAPFLILFCIFALS